MGRILIKNGTIVNEGKSFKGNLVLENDKIVDITTNESGNYDQVIDASGQFVLPGAIDDQVHFREPGLTHKGEIFTESKAAIAGGITSYMEMPNTVPNALTQDLLEDKYKIAAQRSFANYSFFMGVSNDNIKEVIKTDPKNVCGIKVFMGSSTGNMLVDNSETLEELFAKAPTIIAAHCEDEATIKANLEKYKGKEGIDATYHPIIRDVDACYISSSKAIQLANKHNARLHILHISTAKETELFTNSIPLKEKKITSEACIHHLWFSDEDYKTKGNFIKWNPAVKSAADREGIWKAVLDGRIDVIATDHAPHTFEEKSKPYPEAPSGGPLVQHALLAMYEFVKNGKLPVETVVQKMAHNVADLFQIEKRGYIRQGYYADIVILDPNQKTTVSKNNLHYKCGWSPFEGQVFNSKVTHTFINGDLVFCNDKFDETPKGKRLTFER